MPLYWTIAKVLLKWFAPRPSDLVAAVAALKREPLPAQASLHRTETRVAELQRLLAAHVQRLEQANAQLALIQQALGRLTVVTALALLLALIAIGLFLWNLAHAGAAETAPFMALLSVR